MTYEVPVCEVIKLDNVDILTASFGDMSIIDMPNSDTTNFGG